MSRLSNSHMTEYETLAVLIPTAEESQIKSFIERSRTLIEKNGGKHIQAQNWGIKKLGWERDGQTKGIYIQHRYLGKGGLVSEYERTLKIDESVMLRQTIALRKGVVSDTVETLNDELKPKKDEPSAA